VAQEDKQLLSRLMELYRYDCSQYDNSRLNRHGLFGYKYLDHYWTEKGRHPFLIMADGMIAGFVLVSDICCLCAPGEASSVSEFFVMRGFRRKGVGRAAAVSVFRMYPGKWEVVQHPDNKASMRFWENVIEDVTRGQYRKLEAETETWTGQALIFTQQ